MTDTNSNEVINLTSFNGGNYPKTIGEIDTWPIDNEQVLVDMVNLTKEKSITKDFSAVFKVDYSYTTLTSRLKSKGWINGWHRSTTTPITSKPESKQAVTTELVINEKWNKDELDKIRLTIPKSLKERWSLYPASIDLNTAALTRLQSNLSPVQTWDYIKNVVEASERKSKLKGMNILLEVPDTENMEYSEPLEKRA